MTGPLARHHPAGHRVGRDVVGRPHQPALEQRRIDQAALACRRALGQGCQNADRRPHAGRQVDDGYADARLRSRRIAVQRDQPRHRLDDRLVARPLLPWSEMAEGAQVGVDQSREAFGERLAVDAELGWHVGPEIVHEYVRRADALDQSLAFRLVGEIAGDRLLAAIEGNETQRIAFDEGRALFARVVALWPLDLNDVRPEEGQDLPAIGAGQVLAELDDLDAFEGFVHLRLLPRISRATTMRCTSLGPSPTRRMRISRYQRSSGRSLVMPMPPWICIARSTTRPPPSDAVSLARAASVRKGRPRRAFSAASRVKWRAERMSISLSTSIHCTAWRLASFSPKVVRILAHSIAISWAAMATPMQPAA